MRIINAGNIIMNTYVYPCFNGYIMVDTGYEHSLKDAESKLNRNGIKLSEIQYVIIWIEDKVDFEKSWDVLFAENADFVYPAHGSPFPTSDLAKYKQYISKIHLYKLK